ncbi:MAG: carotenoid biosynthesis protein [Deltaproteobacteria bacterium]|nr:carotenoid biosynthesis protein [Deltaproteobacteria bacterium]
MLAIELWAGAIVVLYVVLRARRDPRPPAFLARMALLALAAWAAENSVIRAYDFYTYAPEWSFFVDRVPLLIALIWPVVVHSGIDLARRLVGDRPVPVAFAVAGLVLADASLIEPICVRAGLWWWSEPGLWNVPVIGILGWAVFAGLAAFVLTTFEARRASQCLVLLIAPIASHVVLVALWWALFRWIEGAVAELPVVIVAWALSLALAWGASRSSAAARVPLAELLLRVPGALFFFVLLTTIAPPALLVLYALSFAAPYLALTVRAARVARSARELR